MFSIPCSKFPLFQNVCTFYIIKKLNFYFTHIKDSCAPPIGGYVMNMTSHSASCRIPKLDPFHAHAMKLVKDLKDPIRCKNEQRAILNGGVLNITGKHHLKYWLTPIILLLQNNAKD